MASFAAVESEKRRAELDARYQIEILDHAMSSQGFLRGWDSLEMVERYCDVGTGKVNAPGSDHNREIVQAGGFVVVKRDGVVQHAGPLKFGEDQGDSIVLKVDWRDGLQFLNRRLTLPDPAGVVGDNGATFGENGVFRFSRAFDEGQGLTSSVIRDYVIWNAAERALPFRQIPGLVVGPDPFAGATIEAPVLARMDNLLQFCAKLATTGGVQFWVDYDDRAWTFQTRQVAYLADEVVFSAQTHGIRQASFMMNPPEVTHLFVGGKGEEADRQFAMCTSYPSLADAYAWGSVEGFRDDRSAEGLSLIEGGWRDLADKGSSVTASFTPTDNTLVYGRDFRLGDIVTGVLRPGLTVEKPIREVTTSVSVANGRKVVPVAGDYSGSETQSARTQASLNRMIAHLNTRV